MDDSRNRSLAELFAGVGALAVCTVTPFFPGAGQSASLAEIVRILIKALTYIQLLSALGC